MNASQEHIAEGFCEECIAESTDQTPGDVSTTNGVGRKFYGGAKPCPTCGSVIRTLWWTCVDVPIIPRGSYRYKTIKEDTIHMSRFWTRRTETQWSQILKTWLVGLVAVAAIAVAICIYESLKSD